MSRPIAPLRQRTQAVGVSDRVPCPTVVRNFLLAATLTFALGCLLALQGCADALEDAPATHDAPTEQIGDSGGAGTAQPPGETTTENPKARGPAKPWTTQLRYDEVTLSPGGGLLLAQVPVPGPGEGWKKPGTVLVVRDLETEVSHTLESLRNLRKIAFSADGQIAWLLRDGGRDLSALRLGDLQVQDSWTVGSSFTGLRVDPQGRYVALTNILPTPPEAVRAGSSQWSCTAQVQGQANVQPVNRCHVALIDLQTGQSHTFAAPWPVRGVDFLPGQAEIAVSWVGPSSQGPQTTLAFYAPESGVTTGLIELSGCSGDLKTLPGQSRMLLSGGPCGAQVMRLVNLQTRAVMAEIPGSRVLVSADGGTAVAWVARKALVEGWSPSSLHTKQGLVVADLDTGFWDVHDFGPSPGSGALSPDGSWLVTFDGPHGGEGVRPVSGSDHPPLRLSRWHLPSGHRADLVDTPAPDSLAWSSDGATLYLLSQGTLLRAQAGHPDLETWSTGLDGQLLAVRPQGDFLLVGRRDAPVFRRVPLWGPATPTPQTFALSVGK